MKKEKAITLIALIITILVLLIIVGISIGMIIGNNGILNKAQTAKEETNSSEVEEENKLGQTNETIDKYTTSRGTVTLTDDQYNSILSRLDSVEQQSGIIESGTSADGLSKYVKYANGYIVEWGTTTGAAWTSGTTRTYTLPLSFTTTSYVVNITKRNGPSYWAQVGYLSNPATISTFNISSWSYGTTYTTGSQILQWTAMGY